MTDRELMTRAIALAREAAEAGEVPVGAVVAKDGWIVAEGRNTRQASGRITGHAELTAIDAACAALGARRLDGCVLYVTLEPCPMCAGAAIQARLDRVVFGAYDPTAGAAGGVTDLFREKFERVPELQCGFMEQPCKLLLQQFFAGLRAGSSD